MNNKKEEIIKRKVGRRCKLTLQLQQKIIELILKGNYVKVACNAVGISEVTYYDWIKRGEHAIKKHRTNKFSKFLKSIEIAQAESESKFVEIVQDASLYDAKHAEWMLERKSWKRWGRKERIEHSTDRDKPFKFEFEIIKKEDKKPEKKKDGDKDSGN